MAKFGIQGGRAVNPSQFSHCQSVIWYYYRKSAVLVSVTGNNTHLFNKFFSVNICPICPSASKTSYGLAISDFFSIGSKLETQSLRVLLLFIC